MSAGNSQPLAFTPATHGEVLRFVWRYTSRHGVLLASMLFLLLLATAVELIQPFFYKEAVDLVSQGIVGNRLLYLRTTIMIGGGLLMGAIHITIHEIAIKMLAWTETRVMRDVHADVFAHAQRLSTEFHVNEFAGATSRKIGRGTDSIEQILDTVWFNFLPLVFTVFGFVAVLSWFAPIMGLAIVGGMLVYVPLSIVLNLYHARFHVWTDRQDTRLTASLVDAITGNPTVKTFGAEHREDVRHGGVLAEWQKRLWRTWQIGNTMSHFQSLLLVGIECVLLLLAVWMSYRGEFTAGGFVVVIFYVGRLWGSMREIGKNVRTYLKAVSHTEEMVGLFQMPIGIADRPGAKHLHVPRGSIVFQDVSFSYERTGKYVFRDFSVDIEAGEKVALVGHSGGGKSTFVKLLQRLYDFQSGRIMIDGQDISEVAQESLRKNIGLVPQDPILFHRSLSENIAYGKHHVTREEIIEAAKKAHAHEFISSLPKEYETLVGERGIKLSGGERQRVAIARVILADTPILVLDEATSSLDSLSESYIQEALDFLMKGRTTIVIAHRLSTIKKVDRILVIEGGKIVEEGNHNALIRKPNGVYRGFYELQAGGFIGE